MTLLSKLSALLLILMAVTVCIHILLRAFFNSGVSGVYELVQYTMLAIVAFSLAENQLTNGSIITTFLLDKMKPRVANIIQIVMYFITVCVMLFVFYNQIRMAIQAFNTGASTDVLGISNWIFITIVCIGLFFYAIAYAISAYTLIDNHKNLTDEKISYEEKAANMASSSEL